MASTLKRLAGLIAASAVLALALAAVAGVAPALALNAGGLTDDSSASITVHKYKTQSASNTPGTGEDGQGVPVGAEPLGGVDFTLYKLDAAKVEGAVAGTPAAPGAPSADGVGSFLSLYRDPGVAANVQTTEAAQGIATWTGLPFGYYLLVETGSDGANVDRAVPSIVTLPYAQQAVGGSTVYETNVHVYPKNVSLEEVEKTTLGEPDATAPGDTLQYQIAFKVPGINKVHPDGSHFMKGTIVDEVPMNAAGQPMLAIQSNFTVVALSGGGVETPLDAGGLAYRDSTSSDGQVSWTIEESLAEAVENIDTANAGNPDGQIVKVLIRINAVVTANAFNAAIGADGQPSVANTAVVTVNDSDGYATIDNGRSTTTPLPTTGFSFAKVDADGNPVTSDTATFKLASSYDGAVAGSFIGDGSTGADLQAVTSAVDGKAVFSGLNAASLVSGGGSYGAVAQAVQAARANLGAPQTVELWMVETEAPNGYRILQAPQKVTIQVVKATASSKVTTSVVDGPVSIVNVRNGQEGGGNFALPNTGGMGALFFIVAGVALVAFAAVGFARSRRHDRAGRR